MVWLGETWNCNGMFRIRRIVMAYFQTSEIVMAPIKKPKKKNQIDSPSTRVAPILSPSLQPTAAVAVDSRPEFYDPRGTHPSARRRPVRFELRVVATLLSSSPPGQHLPPPLPPTTGRSPSAPQVLPQLALDPRQQEPIVSPAAPAACDPPAGTRSPLISPSISVVLVNFCPCC